jgi:hypothetical protein
MGVSPRKIEKMRIQSYFTRKEKKRPNLAM